MAVKDARMNRRGPINWKLWLSCLLGVALLVGVVAAARQFGRPGEVSAQAPRQQQAPQSAPLPPPGQPQGPITLMAVVNGQQVTRQYLGHECLVRYGEEVLETLINRQLITDECQRRGITVTQQEIDDDIARKAKMFSLTTDSYLSLLKRERNIDAREYGRDIIWPTLAMRKLAAGQTEVSETDIQNAIESQIGPQVKVRLIALASREEAERIRRQAVAAPDDFGALAKEHSKDVTSAAGRGWIPPIRKHVGDPNVERVAFGMQEGEISPVIEVGGQFVILKCEGHVEGQSMTNIPKPQYDIMRERITEYLRDQKMREVAAGMFDQLQKTAQVQNVYNNPQLHKQMPDVAAMINGRPIGLPQLEEDCIARHGIEVLDGEINRILITQEIARRGVTVTQADIDHEVARAAESYGLSVKDWLEKVVKEDDVSVGLYVRDAVWPSVALKKLVADDVTVTDDDLQKGYVANFGERVEAQAIVLGNDRQAQEVWEMARGNNTESFFGELAHQYSVDPTSRAMYGQIPPIARYAGQPKLEEEAFKLRPGELSGLIHAGDQIVILRCRGRTTPEVQDFNAVRDELYKDILEKKLRLAMAKLFDHLKETAQIDNFLAGTSQSGKPAMPPGAQSPPTGRIGSRVPFTGRTPPPRPQPPPPGLPQQPQRR